MINRILAIQCIEEFPNTDQSCAVVGSSNTLLGSGYGDEIDKHDVIIRCNQAITEGFETDVGSKTTMRFVNSHSFHSPTKTWPSRQSIQEKHPTFDVDYLMKIRNQTIVAKDHAVFSVTPLVIRQLRENNNRVLSVTPKCLAICKQITQKDPTCGFVAIVASLRHFKNVNCYGFIMGPDGYHHYYERIKPYNQDCHNLNKETTLLQDLGIIIK